MLVRSTDARPYLPSQIKAHTDGDNGQAFKYGHVSVVDVTAEFTVDGLSADTTYLLYAIGSNETGDGEFIVYSFYRTDATLTAFTGYEGGFHNGKLTPIYTGGLNGYAFYYLTSTDAGSGANVPLPDDVVNRGMRVDLSPASPDAALYGLSPVATTRVYGVIVDGDQRSEVVSIDIAADEGSGFPGGPGFPGYLGGPEFP
ncbi:hypothetical protein [Paenibacillus glycinis]|uniref:Uncharacterized protein n=1 Tax=Paenibacillus glycinis TaxID=2697035 RepID=A0ABW9XNZ5_9BACL|nr:hypothetical protein [Paenibacillus glycinis]NBD24353.1 hypothetical protein [Paenibacillus glycinis]